MVFGVPCKSAGEGGLKDLNPFSGTRPKKKHVCVGGFPKQNGHPRKLPVTLPFGSLVATGPLDEMFGFQAVRVVWWRPHQKSSASEEMVLFFLSGHNWDLGIPDF